LAVLEAQGLSTNILSGTAEEVAAKIGAVKEPKLREMANRIAATLYNFRSQISGAAFTESEARAYAQLFPQIGNTYGLNVANINGFTKASNDFIESYDQQMFGGYNWEQIMAPIKVIDKKTKQVGSVPRYEFDPTKYYLEPQGMERI
jgi:hypothetical protein